jgi:hypothetical protein
MVSQCVYHCRLGSTPGLPDILVPVPTFPVTALIRWKELSPKVDLDEVYYCSNPSGVLWSVPHAA